MEGMAIPMFAILASLHLASSKELEFPIRMPNVQPLEPDTYLDYAVKLPEDRTYYIVAFEPKLTMDTVHHMIVSGCTSTTTINRELKCLETNIIYAWAKNAPMLILPKGVGVKIGQDAPIKYINLQLHYANVSRFKGGEHDSSGLNLHLTDIPQPKSAGVLLLATGGYISPNTTENFDVSCKITEDVEFHPFAFRTHAHKLGRVIYGYVVRHGEVSSKDAWTLVGKKSPQLPQAFYPAMNDITVKRGDTLAARCVMSNFSNRTVFVGSTSDSEMCNFYIMYWMDKDQFPLRESCWGAGPPVDYWNSSLNNIPLDSNILFM